MIRFYGMSLEQIYALDHEEYLMLFKASETLQARENIVSLRIEDWPNMKKEARSKLFRDLNKLANPSILREEGKPLTAENLAAILNRG